jgi:hypothetical protein
MHVAVDPHREKQGTVVEIGGGAQWTRTRWASVVLKAGAQLMPRLQSEVKVVMRHPVDALDCNRKWRCGGLKSGPGVVSCNRRWARSRQKRTEVCGGAPSLEAMADVVGWHRGSGRRISLGGLVAVDSEDRAGEGTAWIRMWCMVGIKDGPRGSTDSL